MSLEGDSDTAQTEGGHSNSAAVSKLRKAQKEPNLPTSGTQRTFSFYNCEKIYFCYARHSVSGVLLWQPEKMNTPAFSTSLLFIWMAADDHLMREQWGGQKAQTMGFSLESMTSAAACWRHAGHACVTVHQRLCTQNSPGSGQLIFHLQYGFAFPGIQSSWSSDAPPGGGDWLRSALNLMLCYLLIYKVLTCM